MRTCLALVLSLVTLFPALAAAQPVFFDDFDGDDLLPHWSTPPDSHWEYEVSGGMLNVTGLFWPSDPEDESNWAIIGARYEPQTDFRADVWMGWDAGDGPHELVFHVNSPQGVLASFGYSTWLEPDPVIFAAASNQGITEPAPPPGMYQFTVIRRGAGFEFFFNGEPFANLTDLSGRQVSGLNLWFLGPYPGQLGALHVDRVRVVPSPGVLACLAAVGLSWLHRSRRRAQSGR